MSFLQPSKLRSAVLAIESSSVRRRPTVPAGAKRCRRAPWGGALPWSNPSARRIFRDEIGPSETPVARSTFLAGESSGQGSGAWAREHSLVQYGRGSEKYPMGYRCCP